MTQSLRGCATCASSAFFLPLGERAAVWWCDGVIMFARCMIVSWAWVWVGFVTVPRVPVRRGMMGCWVKLVAVSEACTVPVRIRRSRSFRRSVSSTRTAVFLIDTIRHEGGTEGSGRSCVENEEMVRGWGWTWKWRTCIRVHTVQYSTGQYGGEGKPSHISRWPRSMCSMLHASCFMLHAPCLIPHASWHDEDSLSSLSMPAKSSQVKAGDTRG